MPQSRDSLRESELEEALDQALYENDYLRAEVKELETKLEITTNEIHKLEDKLSYVKEAYECYYSPIIEVSKQRLKITSAMLNSIIITVQEGKPADETISKIHAILEEYQFKK